MTHIRVEVSSDLHKQLKQIALDQDKSLKTVVIEALYNYAKRKRK